MIFRQSPLCFTTMVDNRYLNFLYPNKIGEYPAFLYPVPGRIPDMASMIPNIARQISGYRKGQMSGYRKCRISGRIGS